MGLPIEQCVKSAMAKHNIMGRSALHRKKVWALVATALALFGVSFGYAAKAATVDSAVTTHSSEPANTPNPPSPVYEYQLSSRPDPFKPFITPKAVNPNELLDDARELTGMQLFEPGQLSLVAIMDTPGGRVAMVEDVAKKGYLLREGVLIGRYGEVTEIRKDQVVVTETAHTRGGEAIKTVISMKLKRDGESQ
ncbi:MAG: pilus assembly protein PilP [Desulfobulbaceae bacterium]|nr:pilus assembly protein PilP [Desulfobulbaceae bacterium]